MNNLQQSLTGLYQIARKLDAKTNINYQNFNLTAENGLTLVKSPSGMTLSISSFANGVLVFQNGNITSVQAPSTNSVLGFLDNSYTWIPLATCYQLSSSSSSSGSSL